MTDCIVAIDDFKAKRELLHHLLAIAGSDAIALSGLPASYLGPRLRGLSQGRLSVYWSSAYGAARASELQVGTRSLPALPPPPIGREVSVVDFYITDFEQPDPPAA